jgi:hypothetical protein
MGEANGSGLWGKKFHCWRSSWPLAWDAGDCERRVGAAEKGWEKAW